MEDSLTNHFSKKFKKLYNSRSLSIEDIVKLNKKQMNELIEKDLKKHFYHDDYLLIDFIGLDKAIKLYKYSKEDYKVVKKICVFIIIDWDYIVEDKAQLDFKDRFNNVSEEEMKKMFFDVMRERLLITTNVIPYQNISQEFIDANEDIFLKKSSLPERFKYKFYAKELNLDDVVNHLDLFQNFPIDSFVINNTYLKEFVSRFGYGNFHKILIAHKDVFQHLAKSGNVFRFSASLIYYYNDYYKNFIYTLKNYLRGYSIKLKKEDLPDWLSSISFSVVDKYHNWDEMKEYNDYVIINDNLQRTIIEEIGFENLKRLESESNFFSSIDNKNTFENIFSMLRLFLNKVDKNLNLDIIRKDISYDLILDNIAEYLTLVRRGVLGDTTYRYDFIKGAFRDKYPDLFIDESAPDELKEAFYTYTLDLDLLNKHPEYIDFLKDKNLETLFVESPAVYVYNEDMEFTKNFVTYYSERFNKEKTLKVLAKYGGLLHWAENIYIKENATEEEIDKEIRLELLNAIFDFNFNYEILKNIPEFVSEHPNLFIDLSNVDSLSKEEKIIIIDQFYNQNLKYETIQEYPILAELLVDKNLSVAFSRRYDDIIGLVDAKISVKTFLQLCLKYGKYLYYINGEELRIDLINSNYEDDVEILESIIERLIAEACKNGAIDYYYEKFIPEFLRNDYPELFLSEDAPKDLKNHFYATIYKFNFNILKQNPDWLPYLENKYIITPFIKGETIFYKTSFKRFLDVFGDKALKVGMHKPETVEMMISLDSISTMKKWYEKTGEKFLPDHIVMRNFPLEEADKFLNSIGYWSKLMKIKNFANHDEGREAMLKLAYSFGVFDNDATGFQKLYELLTCIPHVLDEYSYNLFLNMDIDDIEKYEELKLAAKEENLNIDIDEYFLEKFYRQNADDSYILTFNPQQYPKTSYIIRSWMEESDFVIISPLLAHQLFGDFKLEYNKDFREFLLENLEELCENYEEYISSIQKQFKEIKAINSNRALTLEMVINYVKENKYLNVNVGNEKMAEISSIAGYPQEDFDVLQEIYNYGKMRIFSSIPRIESNLNGYSYEILRLDDPLALAIGTFTNCCQVIHGVGESCMEHSMIDKNGRIFVIRDNEKNIVSQSWVWRNKNVLCFDNIEVPNKAFRRTNISSDDFVLEIYNIYKKAAKELIKEDEKTYKHLLSNKLITQEQYDGLRLGKITVGLGYNDIADAIKNNAQKDFDKITKPLPFNSIINKSSYLYTQDSTEQYILEEIPNKYNYEGETLPIYNDTFILYDDNNFTSTNLDSLIKMEIATKDYKRMLYNYSFDNKTNLVSYIAEVYGLNSNTTRIIMHPNFNIIFSSNEKEIILADIFFNVNVQEFKENINNNKNILMQIYLALKQICSEKKLNEDNLDDDVREIIEQVINLSKDDFDKEKGLIKIRK